MYTVHIENFGRRNSVGANRAGGEQRGADLLWAESRTSGHALLSFATLIKSLRRAHTGNTITGD